MSDLHQRLAGPRVPLRFHLDKRAADLAARLGFEREADPDELLTTRALAALLGVSIVWLRMGRMRRYGPPAIKIAERHIRYRRDDVRRWLLERARLTTS